MLSGTWGQVGVTKVALLSPHTQTQLLHQRISSCIARPPTTHVCVIKLVTRKPVQKVGVCNDSLKSSS